MKEVRDFSSSSSPHSHSLATANRPTPPTNTHPSSSSSSSSPSPSLSSYTLAAHGKQAGNTMPSATAKVVGSSLFISGTAKSPLKERDVKGRGREGERRERERGERERGERELVGKRHGTSDKRKAFRRRVDQEILFEVEPAQPFTSITDAVDCLRVSLSLLSGSPVILENARKSLSYIEGCLLNERTVSVEMEGGRGERGKKETGRVEGEREWKKGERESGERGREAIGGREERGERGGREERVCDLDEEADSGEWVTMERIDADLIPIMEMGDMDKVGKKSQESQEEKEERRREERDVIREYVEELHELRHASQETSHNLTSFGGAAEEVIEIHNLESCPFEKEEASDRSSSSSNWDDDSEGEGEEREEEGGGRRSKREDVSWEEREEREEREEIGDLREVEREKPYKEKEEERGERRGEEIRKEEKGKIGRSVEDLDSIEVDVSDRLSFIEKSAVNGGREGDGSCGREWERGSGSMIRRTRTSETSHRPPYISLPPSSSPSSSSSNIPSSPSSYSTLPSIPVRSLPSQGCECCQSGSAEVGVCADCKRIICQKCRGSKGGCHVCDGKFHSCAWNNKSAESKFFGTVDFGKEATSDMR